MLALAACSGNGSADTRSTDAKGAKPVVQGPAAVAQQVLAQDTGTNYKDIEIISVEAVDFSDSSLGCPQPDMSYLQVITSGHIVMAKIPGSDEVFDVRVAGGFGFVCK